MGKWLKRRTQHMRNNSTAITYTGITLFIAGSIFYIFFEHKNCNIGYTNSIIWEMYYALLWYYVPLFILDHPSPLLYMQYYKPH